MNVKELKQLLVESHIPKNTYNIADDGTPLTPVTIALDYTPRGISVYYTERNEIYGNRYFDNEGQAVEYFAYLLRDTSMIFKQFYNEHQDVFLYRSCTGDEN